MRHSLVEILACPDCKAPLALSVATEGDGEVLEGSLRCATCGEVYPIHEGIPNLLPPALRRSLASEPGDASAAH